MKTRKLIGKTIKKVHQVNWDRGDGSRDGRIWIIEAIEFTDGSFLRFVTVEGLAEYGIAGVYPASEVQR